MSKGSKKADESFLGKKLQTISERLDYLEKNDGFHTGRFLKGFGQNARA